MALSADQSYATRGRSVESVNGTASTTFYAGALVGTASATGLVVLWADTAGHKFMGIATKQVVNASGETAEVAIDTSGLILKDVTVTGASAQTDVGDPVYATDDATFTKSASSNVGEIGHIARWITGTTCDVRLYTPAEYASAN